MRMCALRRDRRDAAIHDRRNADITGRRDGEAIKILQVRHRRHNAAEIERCRLLNFARRAEIKCPQPRRHRIGDIDRALVWRQADAIRRGMMMVEFDRFMRAIREKE